MNKKFVRKIENTINRYKKRFFVNLDVLNYHQAKSFISTDSNGGIISFTTSRKEILDDIKLYRSIMKLERGLDECREKYKMDEFFKKFIILS